jgi:hypothetical protein
MYIRGIELNPSMMLLDIGQIIEWTTIKIIVISPIPNQQIARGSKATPGSKSQMETIRL